MTNPTPADMARRLSPAQRRAIMWLPADTRLARHCPGALPVSLRRLAAWSGHPARGCTYCVGDFGEWWRLTPHGLAVRAEVARMEAGNE
jgi:hypothetical protein